MCTIPYRNLHPLDPGQGPVSQASVFRLLFFCLLCVGLASSPGAVPAAWAQSYPLAITDRAIENPYVLHARNWPPLLGLPTPAIMRSNAGERWFQIETSRGVYNPTFGNLFAPDVTGWMVNAQKYNTQMIYTFNTVPQWAVQSSGKGPASAAPYDIDQANETCVAPLAGQVSAGGNCIWKEWVTALMQRNCGVSAAPGQPLTGKCQIHYFEVWNEFNAPGFWSDSLVHLAKMANDMAGIVRTYCADCQVIAGSTSAGGVGRPGDGAAGSGSFDVALGQLLDAWHAIPHASLPDVVSFHAYPSRTNVSYPPFPETNVSINDAKCAAGSVPNVYCQYAMVDQPGAVRRVLAARPYLGASTPIWNTESGWNGNKTLLHGIDDQGHADAATGLLRQAFLARASILLANRGVAVNLWYEADHQCYGTLYGLGLDPASPQMAECHAESTIPQGLTPAGKALVVLYGWLHGGTFTGPCKASGSTWSCPVTGPATGNAVLAWTTKMDGDDSASLPGGFSYAHTLDGTAVKLLPAAKVALELRPRLFNSQP